MAEVRVDVNDAAVRALASHPGVTAELVAVAERIARRARGNAPRSRRGSHGRPSGYLASKIRVRLGRDAFGTYVDVVTAARTPSGFRYGAYVNARRQYLPAALRQERTR